MGSKEQLSRSFEAMLIEVKLPLGREGESLEVFYGLIYMYLLFFL